MFEKEILIDGRGHMYGRLASIVAKELLKGQRVVLVRSEMLNMSGSLFRNHLKFREFLHKTKNSNPRRGHIHYRTPGRIFWRSVRGMLPHKTARGMAALGRLKAFEGIPHPYDQRKRMVVPGALKVLRLKSHRKYCVLGDLASKIGWKREATIGKLEEKRKEKSKRFYVIKKAKADARAKAENSKEVQKMKAELAKYGF